MTVKRVAQVPHQFARGIDGLSKADLVEILWDVMCQSPWFSEASAHDNPAAVADQVREIKKAIREALRV